MERNVGLIVPTLPIARRITCLIRPISSSWSLMLRIPSESGSTRSGTGVDAVATLNGWITLSSWSDQSSFDQTSLPSSYSDISRHRSRLRTDSQVQNYYIRSLPSSTTSHISAQRESCITITSPTLRNHVHCFTSTQYSPIHQVMNSLPMS